jgi:hypothetical protein
MGNSTTEKNPQPDTESGKRPRAVRWRRPPPSSSPLTQFNRSGATPTIRLTRRPGTNRTSKAQPRVGRHPRGTLVERDQTPGGGAGCNSGAKAECFGRCFQRSEGKRLAVCTPGPWVRPWRLRPGVGGPGMDRCVSATSCPEGPAEGSAARGGGLRGRIQAGSFPLPSCELRRPGTDGWFLRRPRPPTTEVGLAITFPVPRVSTSSDYPIVAESPISASNRSRM